MSLLSRAENLYARKKESQDFNKFGNNTELEDTWCLLQMFFKMEMNT